MVTHTYTEVIRASLGTITSAPSIIEADAEETVANVVPANSTVVETIAIDVSQIAAFYIYSDKDVTVTPSGHAPISVAAGKPYLWHNEQVGDNPLTVDITTITFHNADLVADANVKAEFLLTVAS